MQPVVPGAKREIEPLDGSTQVGLQRFDLQMVMIAHQDIGMDPEAEAFRHSTDQGQEMFVCFIFRKQLSAIDSAVHDVLPAVFQDDA